MPELPEVETVRLGLVPLLEGARFRRVTQRRADLRIPFPPNFAKCLTGRRVLELGRRGKYLLASLDDAHTLVMHLGMSGRFRIVPDGESTKTKRLSLGPHDHVIFTTDKNVQVVFSDHRRFGLMTLVPTNEVAKHPLFADMGVEPLSADFSAQYLGQALAHSRASIKSRLLDQSVVAGLGNIYVCEALFRAHISPRRKAGSLVSAKASAQRIEELVAAIRAVLDEAIKAGGSSLRDYVQADGSTGRFQHNFAVYGRENENCLNCGPNIRIRRIVQAGRSTFYCRICQK